MKASGAATDSASVGIDGSDDQKAPVEAPTLPGSGAFGSSAGGSDVSAFFHHSSEDDSDEGSAWTLSLRAG